MPSSFVLPPCLMESAQHGKPAPSRAMAGSERVESALRIVTRSAERRVTLRHDLPFKLRPTVNASAYLEVENLLIECENVFARCFPYGMLAGELRSQLETLLRRVMLERMRCQERERDGKTG